MQGICDHNTGNYLGSYIRPELSKGRYGKQGGKAVRQKGSNNIQSKRSKMQTKGSTILYKPRPPKTLNPLIRPRTVHSRHLLQMAMAIGDRKAPLAFVLRVASWMIIVLIIANINRETVLGKQHET